MRTAFLFCNTSYSYVVRIKGNVLSDTFPGWPGCRVALWMENSASWRRYCPLEREFPSPIFSNERQ